jgi:transposase
MIVYQIPEETERVAQAAFPKGNLYMHLYEELGAIYSDPLFARLFSQRGQPAESPTRLALVLIMQFLENLTDRQAANAVRSRIDWKYLLGLELTDPGFDFSILSEFRDRLLEGEEEQLLLDIMLDRLQERGLLKARGRQRTDSTHILASVRNLNRIEVVGRTLQHALNTLAQVAPGWLRAQVTSEWFDRYSRLIDEYRLPKEETKRRALAEQIGTDGLHLLTQLAQPSAPAGLAQLEAVSVLRQVWEQQYSIVEGEGRCRWREGKELPPSAQVITSPHDLDARYSAKGSVTWIGYKAHLTETCDEELPHLITHVRTCPGTEDDGAALPIIHAELAKTDRLPTQHVVDTAYTTGELLVSSEQEYGVEVIGPVRPDTSWQGRQAQAQQIQAQQPQAQTQTDAEAQTEMEQEQEQRYDITAFSIDWNKRQAICPQGHVSRFWREERRSNGKPMIQVEFDRAKCRQCGVKERCTRRNDRGRIVTLRPQAPQEALQQARGRQQTTEFKEAYAIRAGVEGTISEAAVAHEMRRSRYRGEAKTHLAHILTAVAMNVVRVIAWWEKRPRVTTRKSPFAALAPV